jgi:hypothetical protein
VLNRGEDLELMPGKVYEITKTLQYKKPGQKIYTKGAHFPSEYATMRNANPEVVTLVTAWPVAQVQFERVICDGNRYKLGVRTYPGGEKVHQPGILNFGGGAGQVVRDCVFMNARGFSNIVVHKGASNQLVENNIVLGAGTDARGNGRAEGEEPRRWSDGISCGAPGSMIQNNLIIDPTDVGIVLYCAPGSVVESNVVASISRESLGGINLVDAFDHYALNEEKTLFDYRGSTVRDNYIDAYGARIHIGIPIGCEPWVAHWAGKILKGGVVTGNTMAGQAGGYGFVAHGITGWTITGNKSTATYSGLAEYGDHPNPPDDPAAFLYDAASVKNTKLQPEFKPCERHIVHLLRTHHAPQDELGYQLHDYGDEEVGAVVTAAFVEMLGRVPSKQEMAKAERLLTSKKMNADGLRRAMMDGAEFRKRHGEVDAETLQAFRVKRWFNLCDEIIRENGGMPPALELYRLALARMEGGNKR